MLVEWDIILVDDALAIHGFVEESLNQSALDQGLRNDLCSVSGLDAKVADLFRKDNNDRPSLAVTVAPGTAKIHLVGQALFHEFLLEGLHNLFTLVRKAAWARADGHARLLGIPVGQDVVAVAFQIFK
jgi:hypothetical protein